MFAIGQCSPMWAMVCGIMLAGCGLDILGAPSRTDEPGALTIDAAEADPLFTGVVVDERGDPVAARVRINGVATESSLATGAFELVVPVATTYILDISRRGYVPFSFKHSGHGLIDFRVVLEHAEAFSLDPAAVIDVTDSHGTRIVIEPGALVDADGNPPQGNVDMFMHTYDVRERPMPGNRDAVDASGNPVYLESVGAFSAEIVDALGTTYDLAPGTTAAITMAVDTDIDGAIPLWWYDRDRGVWREDGAGHVADGVATGQVAHFTEWNFDQSKPDPACVVLEIADPAHNPRTAPVPARVRYSGQFGWTEWKCLDADSNLLYNLPPNKDIEIYIKLDNGGACSAADFSPASANDFVRYGRFNTGRTWKGRSDPDTGDPQKPADRSACAHIDLWTSAIEGIVELEGRASSADATVIAWTGTAGGCQMVMSTTTASDGHYRLFVPSDQGPGYEVTFEAAYFLGSARGNVTVASGERASLPFECLKIGDVNGDDCIDADDTELVSTTSLDITEDGVADLCDSNWVIKNYEVAGTNISCCEAPRTGIDSCLYDNEVMPARLGCDAVACGAAPSQCAP